MSTTAPQASRPAVPAPQLSVTDGSGAIAFHERALGAHRLARMDAEGGGLALWAVLQVNGQQLFLFDHFPPLAHTLPRQAAAPR